MAFSKNKIREYQGIGNPNPLQLERLLIYLLVLLKIKK